VTTPTCEAEKTVVILLDVLNDFLADGGKLNAPIAGMLEKLDFTRTVQRLLRGAREAGVQIYYAPHGIDEHSFDDIKHVLAVWQNAIEHKILWKGTYGDEFYPPLHPQEGDVVLEHHRMFNSFFGTDLNERLEAGGVENVVLAGVTSGTCVENTGRHALESGYHVTYLTDAVAEFTDDAQHAATDIAYPVLGHATLTTDEFLSSVQGRRH
jgi:nicotinamidase-related amidase